MWKGLKEKYIKFSCTELESGSGEPLSVLEVRKMDPTRKVYTKKKRTVGSTSKSVEPTQKKSKNQTSTQTNPEQSSVPESQSLTGIDPVMDIVQQLQEEENVGEEEAETRVETGEGLGGDDVEPETDRETENEPYDDFKFSSSKSQKNFEKYWSKRSAIVERGMLLSHFQNKDFQLKQNFEKRGWSKWAQFSGVAVVPIVQEFYANITSIQQGGKDCIETKVRGVYFKITPKDVRKFFGLKEEKEPQFPFSADEALDKDSLARVLTGKINAEWGHKIKLAKNRLTPKFNSLHFLACSQLNPVLNTSEISYERGLLLYAIDEGMRVELGQIIWDSIAAIFKTRKGISSLPFAGFITKYVCKKKVNTELGEQVAKPLGPITASLCERSVSHKKGKGEASTTESIDKMNDKWNEVMEALTDIKDTQYVIKRELQEQGRRIANIENQLKLFLAAGAGSSDSSSHGDHHGDI